jgi:hypothetical protein
MNRLYVLTVCHVNRRETRRHLPSGGSLGSHFPTYSSPEKKFLTHRYYVPLRLPKAHLGSFSCPSVPDTLRTSCVSCSFSGSLGHGSHFPTPGLFGQPVIPFLRYVSCKETVGSPRFPGYPLSTCPALRPRWYPEHSPFAHPGLLPSPHLHKVGVHVSMTRHAIL